MNVLEEYLCRIADNSESYFQAFLAKEDLARVRKLAAMAEETCDLEALQRDGLYIGWTAGDLRTGELKEQIMPLIAALHASMQKSGDRESSEALMAAWKMFHEERLKILIHCL